MARLFGERNRVVEWSLDSERGTGGDPGATEVDALITDPEGREARVPAFWAGEGTWTVRYASPVTGIHRYRTVCTDASDSGLHGREGEVEVRDYGGTNPLYRHGPLQVADDGRHFEHADGTPFLWLGDTWWMGLCARLGWPEEFQELLADRAAKGFSVLQIVAGLYPDMPPFDPRGANEAGFPWSPDYERLNPAYFDMADLRLRKVVAAGLVPCLVGCWGYFLKWMGAEAMKRHWRNLVARYGAYPVVWCLAGEGSMPWYLSENPAEDRAELRRGWTEIAAYVRQVDPFRRPLTIHPSASARETLEDPSLLDFDMLQTGHGDRASLPNTVLSLCRSLEAEPRIPALVGEVSYEGILGQSREEVQRFAFWTCLLSGAAGHTYGANGIWQVNRPEEPFGPSPHGRSWGDTPWQRAAQLPGSRQLGLGKALLEELPWWRFQPHPEWVDPHWAPENVFLPYAAGIPGEVRVVYLPMGSAWDPPTVCHLEPGTTYQAFYFDPATGVRTPAGDAAGDAQARWRAPMPPTVQDWVLVLRRETP